MPTPNTDFTIRNATPDDLPAVARLADIISEHDNLEMTVRAEQLQHMLAAPHITLERDLFIVENRDGDVIAGGAGILLPEHGRAYQEVLIHPAYRDQNVGTLLVHRIEELIRTRGETEVEPEKPLYMQCGVLDTQADMLALYEREGFAIVRYFYEMRRPLDEPVTPSPLPAGLELRPFDKTAHAHAVYEAQQETFVDHWGYAPAPFEVWAHNWLNDDEQDYTLWKIAWNGDSIAGFALNSAPNGQHPNYAQVDILGVRRAWRRKGLGLALLLHSFAAFQACGWTTAGLGVDAASKTNAVALYERAGMHVHRRFCSLRKILRGNPEDIAD